jgi:hypothetical protein
MRAPERTTVAIPSMPSAAAGQVEAVKSDPSGLHLLVRYPLESAPVLPVGRSGELRIQHEATGKDLVVLGKVTMREDCGSRRSYDFLLGERSRQALAPIFEPRRADRVVLAGEVEAYLCPGDGGPALHGVARDLSLGGVCVEVSWKEEARLAGVDGVRVTLLAVGEDRAAAAPDRAAGGAEGASTFLGKLRSRRLGKGVILLGIALEPIPGEGAAASEAALEGWVADFMLRNEEPPADVRRSA